MSREAFAFRPWVRSTCRTAMLWGVGAITVLGVSAWLLRSPDDGFLGKAFAVLLGYGLLFWVSLLKIWWTAGRPAVEIDEVGFGHQPLHTFKPRRIAFDTVLACAPRPGTQSLRFVIESRGRAREFFLNLAVVRRSHRFLDVLGESLEREGLVRDGAGWTRPEA